MLNMFLINFEQQAVCLLIEKKNLFVKGREHYCEGVDLLKRACFVLTAFFLHGDIILIGIIPEVIFFLLEITKLN